MESQPSALQKEILAKISQAAAKNDLPEAARLVQLAQKAEKAEKAFTAELSGIKAEVSKNSAALLAPGLLGSPASKGVTEATESAKAKGKHARLKWLEDLQKKGKSLEKGDGPYFEVAGKTGGIAYAEEQAERPDRFFLGLADKPVSWIVLLCRCLSGKSIDAILPEAFLQAHWGDLSRSSGQLKMNVKIEHSTLKLHIPAKGWISIQEYVGNYQSL